MPVVIPNLRNRRQKTTKGTSRVKPQTRMKTSGFKKPAKAKPAKAPRFAKGKGTRMRRQRLSMK